MRRSAWERAIRELGRKFGYRLIRRKRLLSLVRDGYPTVFCAATPSDYRAILNVRAVLRRSVREGQKRDAE